MEKIDKYSRWIIPAFVLITFFMWQECQHYKTKSENLKASADFKDQQITTFKNMHDRDVAEQVTARTNNAKEIKNLSAGIFDLNSKLEKKIKEVKALVTVTQQYLLRDSMLVAYKDTSRVPGDSMVHARDVIIPPRSFDTVSSNFRLTGKVLLKGVQIDSIRIYNQVSFRVALKKAGWLRNPEQVVQVINSNPNIKTIGMQSMILEDHVTQWNKWIKPVAAATLTFIIVKKVK